MKLYEKYSGKKLEVAEKIQRRRRQLLVHSYIYYVLDDNIVSDATWSKWAKELAELQSKYPNMSKKIPYAEQFVDWDGSTGAFLEYDEDIIAVAELLLIHETTKHIEQKRKKIVENPVTKKKRRSLF